MCKTKRMLQLYQNAINRLYGYIAYGDIKKEVIQDVLLDLKNNLKDLQNESK